MSKTNLNALDLNLLPPLEALLKHRNVTRAAVEAGMSQPAMSRALSRLRDDLGDTLLIRSKRGYVLTPVAGALLPRVAAALGAVGSIYARETFDPARAERVIRIAATDAQSILLGPAIAGRLAREAPGVSVQFENVRTDLIARLEDGQLDLTFALETSGLPPGAMSLSLARDELVLVMRRGHKAARGTLTVKSYAALEHAVIAIFGDGRSDVDTQLAAAGVTRRIGFVAPHFAAVLAVVAQTNMVTTISRRFAEEFRSTYDVLLRPPPIPNRVLPLTLVWSHVREHDAVLKWFRGVVRNAAVEVYSGGNRLKRTR